MEGGDDGGGEFVGGGFAANVGGGVLVFAVDFFEGGFDAAGGGALAEMVEHHDAGEDEGGGVGEALTDDVGGRAVNGLEHGGLLADVGAADDAEAADEAGGEIAHHVAVKIGEKEHVKLLRIQNDLHAGVVHDEFFVFDFGVLRGDGADGFEEEAVRKLHDVGFVDGVDFFAALALGVFEGEVRDLRGCSFRNDFQAFDDSGNDFVFEAGVKVFGVFANEDDVHVFKARFHAGKIFDGANVGVKIEGFAEADVDAGRAAGDGGTHRAFEGDAIAADGLDGRFGDELALFRGFVGAGLDLFPFDLYAGGLEDLASGGGDFRADTFAGDECDAVSHGGILLYAKDLGLTNRGRSAVSGKEIGDEGAACSWLTDLV